jgi:hypothetical protein
LRIEPLVWLKLKMTIKMQYETTPNENNKRKNSKFLFNPRWFGLLISYVLLMFNVYLGAYLKYGIPKDYLKGYLRKHRLTWVMGYIKLPKVDS